MGRIATADAQYHAAAEKSEPLLGRRMVVFDGLEHETPVLMREWLAAESRHEGPVVIEEQSSTTVVPPGHVATLDEHANILISRA
jgi:N-methylhydantoinase A